MFVSVVPGRIRLRHSLLRDPERHSLLYERLRGLVQVTSDPKVGSLLLRYDPADQTMESRIRAEVEAVLAAGGPRSEAMLSDDAALARRRRQARSKINRVAKIGALAGMTASLAALGVSRKLHAQIGAVAVAMTLAHAAFHWRRTFR